MGVFRKTTNPPSPVPTEELKLNMPERTASSFESITSKKVRPATSAEIEPHPAAASSPPRPQILTRMPSIQTRYMGMLLHLDAIPRLHNILAAVFSWILLAGFLVIPGTFTSIKNKTGNGDTNAVEGAIFNSIAHIGLVWVSGAFCIIGAIGCCWLWFLWRQNYVWLINRIFFPVLLNSIAGLLTTIVNVETAQKGVFSITAKITTIVTGSCAGVALVLFVVYNNWILEKVKEKHLRELESEGQHEHETPVEKVKRKATEPGMEPGSVV